MLADSSRLLSPRAMTIEPVAKSRSANMAALALAVLFSGMASGAHAAKFAALYSFGVVDATQNTPGAPFVQGRDGKLYGEMNANRSDIYAVTPAGGLTLLWQSPQSPALRDQCSTGSRTAFGRGPDGRLDSAHVAALQRIERLGLEIAGPGCP